MISTFLAFATGIAAKISYPKDDPRDRKIRALEAQVDDLKREMDDHIASITRQRDDCLAIAESWRRRFFDAVPPTEEELRQRQQTRQMQMQMLAQVQLMHVQLAQQNMNAQNAQSAYHHGPLGGLGQMNEAQALLDVERFCNCVPARHDMFTGVFRGNS
jgi:hypothetical protein